MPPPHEGFELEMKIQETSESVEKKAYDISFSTVEESSGGGVYRSKSEYQSGNTYREKGKYQVDDGEFF